MKKHNKDVLRATLFALIAIFIMIGAAGLLFAEHKKKLQKEQQKNAACYRTCRKRCRKGFS